MREADNSTSTLFTTSRCGYVGFAIPDTGNGLGNHLFYYSAVVYVASLTGRRACISTPMISARATTSSSTLTPRPAPFGVSGWTTPRRGHRDSPWKSQSE